MCLLSRVTQYSMKEYKTEVVDKKVNNQGLLKMDVGKVMDQVEVMVCW